MEEDLARDLQAAREENLALRETVARSQKMADAAVEELQSFVYAASHDLKEVLRSISSYSHLILRKLPSEPELDEYGGYLSSGVSSAVELLDRMNTFAHIDPAPPMTTVNLAVLVQILGLKLQPLLKQTGAALTFGHLSSLTANEAQMLSLLEQLVENAVRYRTAEAPVIHISAVEEDNGTILSVRDNACGIADRYQEQVFKPFKRLHAKDISGAGLGLAMAQKIALAHQGRIWVESDGATGSTFKTFIPF